MRTAVLLACLALSGCAVPPPAPLVEPTPMPVMSRGLGDCAARQPSGIHCYKVPPDLSARR